jgi:hypothetical protein
VLEQWSEFDSEKTNVGSEASGESSANGVAPESAIGVAEPLGEEPATTEVESTDESPVAAESIEPAGEGSLSDADAATAEAAAAAAAAAATAESPDEASEFLAELVRAMRSAAGLERARIGEDIDRRRQEQIHEVQARQAAEADRMRELAGEDVQAIEAWVEVETGRIQLERERRATAVREDLETSLAEHGSKIDREIETVERAISIYRAQVEAFFDSLDGETDPILIAQKAASRPLFPALGAATETVAVASPVAEVEAEPWSGDESAVVGVMDPQAAAEPAESWAATAETSPEPDQAEALDDVDTGSVIPARDGAEAEAPPVSAGVGGPGALLKSVPAKRPMSWLWRSED